MTTETVFCSPLLCGILGVFFDIFGRYRGTFYFAGITVLLSAVVFYPVGRVSRWEKRRLLKK